MVFLPIWNKPSSFYGTWLLSMSPFSGSIIGVILLVIVLVAATGSPVV